MSNREVHSIVVDLAHWDGDRPGVTAALARRGWDIERVEDMEARPAKRLILARRPGVQPTENE